MIYSCAPFPFLDLWRSFHPYHRIAHPFNLPGSSGLFRSEYHQQDWKTTLVLLQLQVLFPHQKRSVAHQASRFYTQMQKYRRCTQNRSKTTNAWPEENSLSSRTKDCAKKTQLQFGVQLCRACNVRGGGCSTWLRPLLMIASEMTRQRHHHLTAGRPQRCWMRCPPPMIRPCNSHESRT